MSARFEDGPKGNLFPSQERGLTWAPRKLSPLQLATRAGTSMRHSRIMPIDAELKEILLQHAAWVKHNRSFPYLYDP
jgi:hypothetical protein